MSSTPISGQEIFLGTTPDDHTGDPLRVGGQKLNDWQISGYSRTFFAGAATYNPGGAQTNESRINACIVAAGAYLLANPGPVYVLVPEFMHPFDATLITYNTGVIMISEGHNPGDWDLFAWGFRGDGGASDLAAIGARQAAINAAIAAHKLERCSDTEALAITPLRGYTSTRYAGSDGDSNQGVTFRGRVANGTQQAPGNTQPGNIVAFSGHTTPDGVNFFGQGEIVLAAAEAVDGTHAGTFWNFRTTKGGDTVLATRWQIGSNGDWVPFVDATYNVGNQNLGLRVLTVDAVNIRTSSNLGSGVFTADGPAGSVRDYVWTTGNSRRWHMRCDSSAESGGNAGSNWVLRAYDDTGATLTDVITITRAAGGNFLINRPLKAQAGGSASFTRHTGIFATHAGAASSSTIDASITSDVLPASALSATSNSIRVVAKGRQTNQPGSFNIKFGATVLGTVAPAAGEAWEFEVTVTRTGAATQLANGRTIHGTTVALITAAPAETLSGAITVDYRGSVTAGGTLNLDLVSLEILAI